MPVPDALLPHALPHPALTPSERRYRIFEYAALFFAIPALLAVPGVHVPLLVIVLSGATASLIWLLNDRSFDRASLWRARVVPAALPRILALWALAIIVLGAIVFFLTRDDFLRLPLNRPGLWLMICVAYPILSVFPQNIIFRTFLFHRYAGVFRSESSLIWASAAAFSFAHIIFHNPLALLLTLMGGLIFARTYHTHRSTLLVSIEHALYGLLLFTIGLGNSLYLPGR